MGRLPENINKDDYRAFIQNIKENIKSSQLKAAIKVNYSLLELYWNMGKEISEKQEKSSWGDGFIKKLSDDLQKEFPDMKGFSERNIRYMCKWYQFYSCELNECGENSILLQPVAELGKRNLELVKMIPWGHNQRILNKCSTVEEALFYVKKTIENGWSRNILEIYLKSKLYQREGKAITNFDKKLPKMQSDLAIQTLKDPYNFDFLTMREGYDERELSKSLIEKISDFLIELGEGFAYVGREYKLNVGGDEFFIDLLFYHIRLHSYVVIELKTGKFKPEYVGQLNFYVTAINNDIRGENDNPTVGLLICKEKNDVVCEYSLQKVEQPIGISAYDIDKIFKEKYRSSLPTIEELEKSLKEEFQEGDDE